MTFYITGVSSGLGRALAEAAVTAGHRVVGTVRRMSDVPTGVHGVLLDLADPEAVATITAAVIDEHGPIDVLVANAGYGHEGLFEESSLADLRRQFEVNVFGTVAVIKAVLPHMRTRRRGRILAVTSVGGLTTSPGLSFYHGSKFALEGILESLGKEVGPLGVHVTAVEPGPFRTRWSGASMSHSDRSIEDYDGFYEPIRAARAAYDGHQPGDPVRAAAALLRVLDDPAPPRHLLLGSAALDAVTAAQAALAKEVDDWRELTVSTDFP